MFSGPSETLMLLRSPQCIWEWIMKICQYVIQLCIIFFLLGNTKRIWAALSHINNVDGASCCKGQKCTCVLFCVLTQKCNSVSQPWSWRTLNSIHFGCLPNLTYLNYCSFWNLQQSELNQICLITEIKMCIVGLLQEQALSFLKIYNSWCMEQISIKVVVRW